MPGKILFCVLATATVGFVAGQYLPRPGGKTRFLANPYGGAVIGACLGFVVGSLFFSGPSRPPASPHLVEIERREQFDRLLSSGEDLVLVEFSSPTCPPCWRMWPAINNMADRYRGRAQIATVNTKEAEALAEQYDIRALPTLILFSGGREVEREVGYRSEEQMTAMVEQHLGSEPPGGHEKQTEADK